jgi:hypothetical protein
MTTTARHIRMKLAREPGHPDGDPGVGYDLVAFLDEEGRLDLEACRADPTRCRVRRFVEAETVAIGQLRHSTGDRWLLEFPETEGEDATGFRLGDERFVVGEYISIISGDGTVHTYCIERVADV